MADQVPVDKSNHSILFGWFWDSALGQWFTRRLACTDTGVLKVHQASSDVPYAESYKFQDGVTAKTTRSTLHGIANAVMETTDVSFYLPFDTLMLIDSVAGTDPVNINLHLRPGSKGVLIISGLNASTLTLVGVTNGVVSSAIKVYPIANDTPQTAMGNGSFVFGL